VAQVRLDTAIREDDTATRGETAMKTTMEICKEAGFPLLSFEGVTYVSPELERLVALVRADERAAPVQEPAATLAVRWHEPVGKVAYVLEVNLPLGIHKLYNIPPVPDAFGTREGEHPQYIQGWNDCRAEMLRGKTK
jgi:hypothetical protein